MQNPSLMTQRRVLVKILQEAQSPIDAKELCRRANTRNRSISWATMYRSPNLFKQLGLIDERRLTKARCSYEIRQPLEHMHLACRCCGKIIEFENSLVRKLVEIVRREHCFDVTKVDLYLEGYCSKCDGGKEVH